MIDIKFKAKNWDRGGAAFAASFPKRVGEQLTVILNKETLPKTQQDVHEITQSLRLSGRVLPPIVTAREVVGGIRYGGPSSGVNDPVEYAEYELRRGGDHDFLNPALVESMDDFERVTEGAFLQVMELWK